MSLSHHIEKEIPQTRYGNGIRSGQLETIFFDVGISEMLTVNATLKCPGELEFGRDICRKDDEESRRLPRLWSETEMHWCFADTLLTATTYSQPFI